MEGKTKTKIKVKNVSVIDRSLKFTLYTEDGSPFNCTLSVNVSVQNVARYQSMASVFDTVVADHLDFAVPFGDPNWALEIGGIFRYNLIVILSPQDGTLPYAITFNGVTHHKITPISLDNVKLDVTEVKAVDPGLEFYLEGPPGFFFNHNIINGHFTLTWTNGHTYTAQTPENSNPITSDGPISPLIKVNFPNVAWSEGGPSCPYTISFDLAPAQPTGTTIDPISKSGDAPVMSGGPDNG